MKEFELGARSELTEYFRFASSDDTQAVERDLHQMEAKVLSPVEQDILAGKQEEFLSALLADGQMKAGDVRVSDCLEADLKQAFLSKPSS